MASLSLEAARFASRREVASGRASVTRHSRVQDLRGVMSWHVFLKPKRTWPRPGTKRGSSATIDASEQASHVSPVA